MHSAMNANGSSGIITANSTATIAATIAAPTASSTNGSTASSTSDFRTKRSRRKGRNSSANGSSSTPNSRPKTIRNGSVSRKNIADPSRARLRPGPSGSFTSGGLEEFRGVQLVHFLAADAWSEVGLRLEADALVKALDHRCPAPRRFLGLGEPEHDAEADEQKQHEGGARQHALQGAYRDLKGVRVHASAPASASSTGLAGGTS